MDAGPIVLSLMTQARMPAKEPQRGPFSVLVRHLLQRALATGSLGWGEEANARALTIAYALALPGILYALYMFPAYHQPAGKPSFWAQAVDHDFYVTYSFAVVGLVTALQFDALFPDSLDTLILSTLPLLRRRLLLARVTALLVFFGGMLAGVNSLGIVLFPAVTDLPGAGRRLLGSQAVAVLLAGLCAMCSLIALEGALICVFGQRARRILPTMQFACVSLLVACLLAFPAISHTLPALLHRRLAFLFPPFWFLGVYERLLHGSATPQPFPELARTGGLASVIALLAALCIYPLAYTRRTQQAIEGTATQVRATRPKITATLLHGSLLRDPRARAIWHWIGQTVLRTTPTRLLLAIFAGLGFATVLECLVNFGARQARSAPYLHSAMWLHAGFSPYGIGVAIPMTAFWVVAALRTAFQAPVAKPGAWAFRVIEGRAKRSHLQGAQTWAGACAVTVTVCVFAALEAFAPAQNHRTLALAAQGLLACALPLLLTQAFFLQERTTPFTHEHPYSVNELSWLVVTYFLCLPLFSLAMAAWEPWLQHSVAHLALGGLLLASTGVCFHVVQQRSLRQHSRELDLEADESLLPGEMGLRN